VRDYQFHEYSEFFPPMQGEEFDGLVTDIKEHGLLEPIILLGGKILDGRNRFRACKAAGVEARFTDYRGNGALTYVISKNVKRRHLNPSQLAVIALEVLPQLEREAAERRRTSRSPDLNVSEEKGQARDKAAALLGIGGVQVSRAKRIKKEKPERLKDIKAGKATIGEVDKEIRQEKAKKRVAEQNGKKSAKRRQEEPREVGQFLDAMKVWRKALTEAVEIAKFGKFSPEAKRFVVKWLDDLEKKTTELRRQLDA